MATDDELFLAWVAGVFEGEGSVRINVRTPRNSGALLVDMVNTNEGLVLPFHERWGGYLRRVEARPPRSAYWRWRLAARQAERFLRQVEPHLRSSRLRERVALGLLYQEQKATSWAARTPEYQARQDEFYERMRALNVRGCEETA